MLRFTVLLAAVTATAASLPRVSFAQQGGLSPPDGGLTVDGGPDGGGHSAPTGRPELAAPTPPPDESNGGSGDGDKGSRTGPDEPRRAVGDEGLGETEAASPGNYTVRMLLQTRYRLTFPDITAGLVDQVNQLLTDPASAAHALQSIRDAAREHDGLDISRAFLRLTFRPNEIVSGKLLLDFAELLHKNERKTVKLAFIQVTPEETVSVYAGLFKIPFSLLELLPIADYELADVGPTDELIKDLGFGGRDIGVMVDVAPLRKKKWLHLQLGAFTGENGGAQSWRGPGVVAGRAVWRPNKHFRVGLDGAWRPRAVGDWETGVRLEKYAAGRAASVDLTIVWKKFELRTEAMLGDRTDLGPTAGLIVARRPAARTFVAAWALLAKRFVVSSNFTLIPAARAEWLDEEREVPSGRSVYLTAGFNIDYQNRLRLLLDVSRLWIDPGTPDRSLEFVQFRSDATIGIVQLQMKL